MFKSLVLLIILQQPAFAAVYSITPVNGMMGYFGEYSIAGGYIETDGTLGQLSEENFLNWSVLFGSNSWESPDTRVFLQGTVLATPTEIIFDESVSSRLAFVWYHGDLVYLSTQFSWHYGYSTDLEANVTVVGFTSDWFADSGSTRVVSEQPSVVATRVVPEPSTVALALFVILGVRRR